MAIRSVFGNREDREKKPLTNKEYYRTLIGSRTEAILLADTYGDLHLLNKQAESLSGYSELEIRDYHVRDLFLTFENTENPFSSGQLREFTASLYLLTASRFIVPVMIEVKEIEGQKFLCRCTLVEEVDRRTGGQADKTKGEQEDRLTGGQTDKTKGEQADGRTSGQVEGGMTEFEHGARNLLGNMIGFGTILSMDPLVTGNKQLSSYTDSILKSGIRLKELFNRFTLDESYAHEVIMNSLPAGQLIQKASILLEALAREHNVSVTVNDTGSLFVLSDELLLFDVIRFFLEKAILYSRREKILAEVSSAPDGKVIITIDDVGKDIPREVTGFIKRENNRESYDLTDPLTERSPGIKPVLYALNRIDAKVGFDAGDGHGDIVNIILPGSTGPEQEDGTGRLEASIREKFPRILVVEDEKVTAKIIELFLNNISETTIAFSGNEALNMIENLHVRRLIFDLVIMDVGLPQPWDGITLKQEIEKRWPAYRDVPFLAQTAYVSNDFRERIAAGGFREQMIKPVNRRELLLSVRRFCTGRSK